MSSSEPQSATGPSAKAVGLFLNHLDSTSHNIIFPIYFEAMLFGMFTLLIIVSAYILIRWNTKTMSGKIMFAAIITMYIMSALQWAIDINFVSLETGVIMPSFLVRVDAATHNRLNELKYIVAIPNITLAVNVILSDSIVLWRTCAIWQNHRAVIATSVMLMLLTAVFYTIFTVQQVIPALAGHFPEFVTPTGTTAFTLSFVSNVLATSLTGFKAWRTHYLTNYVKPRGSGRSVENLLVLLVESGLFYSVIWLVYYVEALNNFTVLGVFGKYVSSGIVQLTGMYPTVIVLLIALQKSSIDQQVSRRMASHQSQSIPFARTSTTFKQV